MQLLAQIGENLGYKVVSIDLFCARRVTATREELREDVVFPRLPGGQS